MSKKSNKKPSKKKSKETVNFLNFSFLDHKSALGPFLLTKLRTRLVQYIVDDENDFWKFVGKYESMLRASGKPELPPPPTDSDDEQLSPYRKSKHLAIQLDDDFMLQQSNCTTVEPHVIAQFKQMLLIYLDFKEKEKFNKIKKMRDMQNALPIARFKEDLRKALQSATTRVIIVAGDTGCGKSTQVPQYLHEFGYSSIACTQPRRLACVSLSKRVAHEMHENYGTKVGFQIRFERNKTQDTNILFITEGLLLRQLTVAANLDQYDVLILDEIHERNLYGDFLLGVTKCLLRAKPQLKLILMSATINVNLFYNYFKEEGACRLLVPGRLFPIRMRYMPPPELELKAGQPATRRSQGENSRIDPAPFVQVISFIDERYPLTERGDVLIFVSGVNEISTVMDAIVEYARTQGNHWLVLPLHSGLALAEQDKVFDYAPDNMRKCIVSTNIAETSLTVDGVRFVIDSGKVKEMSYDTSCRGQRLKEFWVSKSSADQRKGRAGRTGPGVCFRLYTEKQYNDMEAYPTPEIYRVPLDTLLLQMISMGLPDVRVFPFIEAPEAERIEQTILSLKQHCALEVNEKITPLGISLSNLPVDLSIGKMLLMGCVFPDVEQLLTFASLLSVQSPYTNRAHTDHKCESERQSMESDQGDLFTLLRIYSEWVRLKINHENTRKWCHRLGIEEQRFYEICKLRKQFQAILESCRMATPAEASQAALSSSERARRHGELRQLHALKRKQKFEQPRQRKMLKMQNDEDDELEDNSGQDDMRDVDFRLGHNERQLALLARSADVKQRRDMLLLKLLLVSGFYPQLAIADEFNYCKSGSQQFFHSKLKPFLSMHMNSYFAKDFEILKLTDSDILTKPDYYLPKQPLSNRHQVVCYQSLLETTKPYLMNCIRLPAAQTLLLFSFGVDTNEACNHIVCDEWLALDFPMADNGLQLLCRAIELRKRWNSHLYAKLNELNTEAQPTYRSDSFDKRVLWEDLIDFMSLDVSYTIKRLLPADLKSLYNKQSLPQILALKHNPFDAGYALNPNIEKGGVNVSEHVVYGCLNDPKWTLGMEVALKEHGWKCKLCNYELTEFDTIAKFLHQKQKCKHRPNAYQQPPPLMPYINDASTSRTQDSSDGYYCGNCKTKLQLKTQIDILRHRKICIPN